MFRFNVILVSFDMGNWHRDKKQLGRLLPVVYADSIPGQSNSSASHPSSSKQILLDFRYDILRHFKNIVCTINSFETH